HKERGTIGASSLFACFYYITVFEKVKWSIAILSSEPREQKTIFSAAECTPRNKTNAPAQSRAGAFILYSV
ncbi:hypothetical protein, partial [Schwartzia sp. (in: firmicutes)]